MHPASGYTDPMVSKIATVARAVPYYLLSTFFLPLLCTYEQKGKQAASFTVEPQQNKTNEIKKSQKRDNSMASR